MPAVERVIEQRPAMQIQQQDTEWRGNRRLLFQKTKDVAITAGKVALALSPVAVFLASCGSGSEGPQNPPPCYGPQSGPCPNSGEPSPPSELPTPPPPEYTPDTHYPVPPQYQFTPPPGN